MTNSSAKRKMRVALERTQGLPGENWLLRRYREKYSVLYQPFRGGTPIGMAASEGRVLAGEELERRKAELSATK